MNISITGGTGFIGNFLTSELERKGNSVFQIDRELLKKANREQLKDLLSQSDAVINLAGANIRARWTEETKKLILESRINATRAIVEAINSIRRKPSALISASAVGIYPSDKITAFEEDETHQGTGFLADVCRAWEGETNLISNDVRKVITRFGVVLDTSGGAFPSMVAPLKFGVSAVIGKGDQPFSWVSRADLARGLEFILRRESIRGVVNMTAPSRTTYAAFASETSRLSGKSLTVHIPPILLKWIMGESASVILDGQWVVPRKLLNAGFEFNDPDIATFIDNTISIS